MASELNSQSDVFKLPLPPKDVGEAVYYDKGKDKDRVKGLTLRIRSAGSRRWVFYYRFGGSQKRIGIGDAGAMSLEDARKAARKHLVALDDGRDPSIEKIARRAASELTFSKVMDDYLDARSKDMKERSLEEITRHLKVHWKPLHGHAIGSVNRAIVASRLREIANKNGPVSANRCRSTLSAMYAWAIGEGLCESNPVAGTNKNEESERERVLSNAELARIWLVLPDNAYGRIVKLLMLTGQRRDEIGGLRWTELVDTDKPEKALIDLPGKRTKNGRPNLVPLSGLALSVLKDQHRIVGRDLVFSDGEGGFSNWSRSKEDLDAVCKVKNWTLHDLRRTAATRMATSEDEDEADVGCGVQPHVIEAILNHVSGHKAGVAGIYNRSTYMPEKRAALNKWASLLQVEIAKAEGSNVTQLKRRKARL